MLAGSPTLLMRREAYNVPVTIGCILYVIWLTWWPGQAVPIGVVCRALIFALRGAAIRWNLSVPGWMMTQVKQA